MKNKLIRNTNNASIAGVCSGIADWLNVDGIDETVIRICWVILTIFSAAFPGVILYIILALIIPTYETTGTDTKDDNVKQVV